MQMRKPLRLILFTAPGILLLGGLAWSCYVRWLAASEQRTIDATHFVKLGQARYESASSNSRAPANYVMVVTDGLWSPELNSKKYWNPYQHRPVKLVRQADSDFMGNFSYFALFNEDNLNGIVVSFVPHRPGVKDGLVSIGGECGDNEYLGRGISPSKAYVELKDHFRVWDTPANQNEALKWP